MKTNDKSLSFNRFPVEIMQNTMIIPPILRLEYIAALEKAYRSTDDFIQFIIAREMEMLRELLRLPGRSLEETEVAILSERTD